MINIQEDVDDNVMTYISHMPNTHIDLHWWLISILEANIHSHIYKEATHFWHLILNWQKANFIEFYLNMYI